MSTPLLPRRDRAELWLAAGLKHYYRLRARQTEPAPECAVREFAFGDGAPAPIPRIPRVVWAYWSGPQVPPLIARCFANWRQWSPGFEIRILNDESVQDYVGELPAALGGASATLRADWIRLALLRRHGGIWLDASTVLTAPLDWVLSQQQAAGSDLVAFYLGRYTREDAYPIVENWFLAAPPGSRFLADLEQEFTHTVLPLGGAGYVAHLQRLGGYERLLQGIDMPEYLSMHLAIQQVLRSGRAYRLSLQRAEDGPFWYHAQGHWSRTALKLRLLFFRASDRVPPLIKLRQPDRKRLDLYLARGLYLPDSTVGRYLA